MNFTRAREAAGLSMAESARRLGVTTSAVSQWESGQTFPDARRLAEIAAVYGCTVDELLREDNADALH